MKKELNQEKNELNQENKALMSIIELRQLLRKKHEEKKQKVKEEIREDNEDDDDVSISSQKTDPIPDINAFSLDELEEFDKPLYGKLSDKK